MRALILPAVALALAAGVVLVGGRMVEHPPAVEPVALDQPSPEDLAVLQGDAGSTNSEPGPVAGAPAADRNAPEKAVPPQPSAVAEGLFPEAATSAVVPSGEPSPLAGAGPAKPTGASRMVEPAVIAPPDLAGEQLQREAPREPLSKLSLALPPMPEMKNDWAGTPFFRPLAVESAVFESGGRTIALAGVESVPLAESCDYEGTSWPCGVRARTAFRLWLRGRALVCQLPDEEREVTTARCRLAKQDAGSWLVSNGWARAAPDGPYVQAEEKAREAKMGIFGAPPDTSAISDVPDAPAGAPARSQPIMTEEGVDPQPSLELAPQLEFPPAPPQP